MNSTKQPELVDAIAKLNRRRRKAKAVEGPQWLDEPTGEGEYYVEGIDRVCWIYRAGDDESWMIEFIVTDPGTKRSVIHWDDLVERRVAPCTGRPGE